MIGASQCEVIPAAAVAESGLIFVLLLACFLLAGAGGAYALNPSDRISQYAHTVRRTEDAMFPGAPSAIAQTTDGYLWIGTSAGLQRFDGVRFVRWVSPPDAPPLFRGMILSLRGASDGSLWVGSADGLARLKDGRVTVYGRTGAFSSIHEDQDGSIWTARALTSDPRALCRIAGAALRCFGPADGIPAARGLSLLRSRSGTLWVGTDRGLDRFGEAPPPKSFFRRTLRGDTAGGGVAALAEEADGTLWAGISRSGSGMGLQRIRGGVSHSVVLPGFDGRKLVVSSLLIDRDQTLWIGTLGQGLFRLRGNVADRFGSGDGLSSDSIEALFEDREGDIWVATADGLDQFHNKSVVTFSTRQGLSANRADAVLASRDGQVYIANVDGLDVLQGSTIRILTSRQGLPGRQVTALLEDSRGRLWLGIDDRLAVRDGRQFHIVQGPRGASLGTIMSIVEDTRGDIWAASLIPRHNLYRIHGLAVAQEIPLGPEKYALALGRDPHGGLWIGLRSGGLAHWQGAAIDYVTAHTGLFTGMVASVLVEDDGTVWGTTREGVIAWRHGAFRRLGRREGLPCDSAIDLIRDAHRNLWIHTPCGLVMIEESAVSSWWMHPDTPLKARSFEALDGVQPGSPSFEPGITLARDGRLWLANGYTVQTVDPNHLSENRLAPFVHIESLIADDRTWPVSAGVRLPALTRNIQIDYTATSFVQPQRVRFRYRLTGHDRGWQEPGTRRQAFYTDLRPGLYRFQVIASNNDGVWNTTGAELLFEVAPAYYQTRGFRVAVLFCVISVLVLLYQLRLRRLRAQLQRRLGERIVERERIARELHDTLLQGFHSLVLRFQGVVNHMPEQDPNRSRLTTALDRAEDVLTEARERVRDLRTDERLPRTLESVFKDCADYRTAMAAPPVYVTAHGVPGSLHPVVFDEIAKIGCEAISNAVQHSRAGLIRVEILYDRTHLRLFVRDDGVGIDPDILDGGRPGHWGLRNMRERAENIGARLAIRSHRDTGTEVELLIPADIAYRKARRRRGFDRIHS